MKIDFTVVLVRPERLSQLTGEDSRLNVYVALVRGSDPFDAQRTARKELLKADKKAFREELKGEPALKSSEYTMVLTFEGHHSPKWFGWQTGVQTA